MRWYPRRTEDLFRRHEEPKAESDCGKAKPEGAAIGAARKLPSLFKLLPYQAPLFALQHFSSHPYCTRNLLVRRGRYYNRVYAYSAIQQVSLRVTDVCLVRPRIQKEHMLTFLTDQGPLSQPARLIHLLAPKRSWETKPLFT